MTEAVDPAVAAVLGGNPAPAAASPSPAAADPAVDAVIGPATALVGRPSAPGAEAAPGNFSVADKVGAAYDAVAGAIKGNAAEPDLGEAPAYIRGKAVKVGDQGTIGLGGLLDEARTDEGKFDILKQHFPGAAAERDANGNLIANVDGHRFYLNKPGLSGQDANDLLAMITHALVPTSVGTAAGGKLLGPVGKLLGLSAGAAGGIVSQDESARGSGSKMGREETVKDAAIVGLLAPVVGASAEYGAIPASRRLIEWARPSVQAAIGAIFKRPGAVDAQAGAISEQAAAQLRDLGVDVNKISPDIARRIGEMIQSGVKPQTAGRAAEAQAMSPPVPLTAGDASRVPSQQMFESQASKGAYGEPAEKVMQGSLAEKDAALRANAGRIQGEISGGTPQVENAGEGAASAQQALSVAERAKKAEVDAAYEVARSKEASVPKDYALSLQSRAAEATQDFDVAGLPRAQRVFDDLGNMIKEAGDKVDVGKTLERWRRRAVNAADGASSNEERNAIRKMIGAYDEGLSDLVDKSLLVGDEDTAAAWAKARGLNKEYRDTFKAKDLVQTLTDGQVGADGKMALNVGPDDAVRLIFGRGKLGATDGMEADLAKMKGLLPEPEWNKLREEAFLRLMRSQEQGGNRGQGLDRLFSGDKFATALDTALKEAPGAMKTLFSDAELEGMQQLKRVALYATNKIAGGQNTSNTVAAVANAVQKLGDAFGPPGSVGRATLARFVKPIYEGMQASEARTAARGVTPQSRPVPPALTSLFAELPAEPSANRGR